MVNLELCFDDVEIIMEIFIYLFYFIMNGIVNIYGTGCMYLIYEKLMFCYCIFDVCWSEILYIGIYMLKSIYCYMYVL